MTPSRERMVVAFLLAAGFVYRVWRFWEPSLWTDEFVTEWVLGADSLGEVAERAQYGLMPPLYFWLSWPCTQLLGMSTLSLRLPAVLFGSLGLWSLHRLARITCGREVALGALAVAVAHPSLLSFSQEARPYPLGMFLAPLAVAGAWGSVRNDRAAERAYVLATALLGWSHYLFFAVVALLAGWLAWSGLPRRRWLGVHGVIAALLALPAWNAVATTSAGMSPTVMPPVTVESMTSGWRLPELTVLLAVGALAVAVIERGRSPERARDAGDSRDAIGLFLFLLIGVPVVHTILGLLVGQSLYLERYRMPVVVLIAPIFAWLVLRALPLPRPGLALALAAGLLHLVYPLRFLTTSGIATYHNVDVHWDEMLERVDAAWRPGTLVLFQSQLVEASGVGDEPEDRLESYLLSPIRSHYLRNHVAPAYALPPIGDDGRFELVSARRIRAHPETERVLLIAWDDPEHDEAVLHAALPATEWKVQVERVPDIALLIAERR